MSPLDKIESLISQCVDLVYTYQEEVANNSNIPGDLDSQLSCLMRFMTENEML